MPDQRTFLYVKPDFDDLAIKYLKLTEPVRDYALQLGYTVVSLEGSEATSENIHNSLRVYDPLFVFSSGHGCSSVHTTVDYEDVLWVNPGCSDHTHHNTNTHMLSDRVTFLLSCYCGERLIPSIIQNGGRTAIGYSDEFVWVVDVESEVLDDPFAQTFFDPPNYFQSMILDGLNIKSAYDATVARYTQLINAWKKWLDDNPDANPYHRSRAMLTISLMEHNRDVMVVKGEEVNIGGVVKFGFEKAALILVGAIAFNYLVGKYFSSKENKSQWMSTGSEESLSSRRTHFEPL